MDHMCTHPLLVFQIHHIFFITYFHQLNNVLLACWHFHGIFNAYMVFHYTNILVYLINLFLLILLLPVRGYFFFLGFIFF